MNKKLVQGKIIVPRGAMVQPHELVVASILSWTGDDVDFSSKAIKKYYH